MPFTASQLTTFYTNANFGITPTAAEALLLQAYASQNQAGTLSDAATIADVLAFSQDKSDVALATYQFFTGSTPSAAGMAFLVHGGGNPTDLSSAYYAGFNKENRYYNFAINLALDPSSTASAPFAAAWGSLTFAQAVQVAYEQIVGVANVGQTQGAAAIASITAAQSFFQGVAASRAPTANQDLAVKAIMIGYILEEAVKADVGIYAKGIDQLMSQLAQTGTANFGNLIANYPAGSTGVVFALTTGIDAFNGGVGNDTVTGTQSTLSALDTVNGGGGQNVLTISDNGAITGIPAAATITNFSTVNLASATSVTFNTTAITGLGTLNSSSATTNTLTAATTTNVNATSNGGTSVTGGLAVTVVDTAGVDSVTGAAGAVSVTDNAQAANNVTVNGGTSVNVAVTGSTGGTVSIGGTTAPTGAVTVSESVSGAGATGAAVNVTGGTSVSVTDTAANAKNTTATFGAVTVTGGATTTAVTVTETAAATASATVAGVVDSAVSITDVNGASATKAGTIATVSLTNVAGATITDNALTTLNLSGADGAVVVTDNLTTPTVTSLTVNANKVSATSITDTNNELSTITIVETGANALTAINDTGLKTLAVSGTGSLALSAMPASVSALTVSGAAGLTGAAGAPLDVSGASAALVVTDSSSALVSVKIASTQTFAGGASSGQDIVTITADATKAITAGTATNNEIILSGAGSVFTGVASTTPSKISGFSVLGTDAGSSGVFDLSKLPTIHSIDVTGAAAGGVQFVNVVNGTPISIDTAIGGGVTYQTADTNGATDSVTVTVGTSTTGGITTTGQLTLEDSTLLGLGNVTINSTSAPVVAPALPVTNVVSSLNDTGLSSLTFTGIANTTVGNLIDNGSSLTVTNAGVGGVLETITAFTAPNLKTVVFNGNVATPALNLSSTAGVTINASSDNANITSVLTGAGAGKTDAITLGTGTDNVTDNGVGTVNINAAGAATGTDVITVSNAAVANISVAAGAATITANSAGVNSVTLGSTGAAAESITFGSGTNTLVAAAHTGVETVGVAAHGATLSAVVTGLNSSATLSDRINFLGDAAATGAVTVFSTTQINAYANAHALDSTQLSTALAAMFDTTANGGANLAQHGIGEFNFQGNTYIVEQANALGTAIGAADTVVELTGIVPITAASTAAAGILTLHG